MTAHRFLIVALAAAATIAPAAARARSQDVPLVAAASSMNPALEEIAAAFTRETGLRVELVFGASGTLTRQIQGGAPFELLLSADEEYVARLYASGHARDAGTLYAMGRLVLFARTGSPIDPGAGLAALGLLLDAGRIDRFAIASPDLAPYGRAAEAALRAAGVWERITPRLVFGENVAQAARFAVSGSASGGLIPLSIALTPAVSSHGTFAVLPDSLSHPVRQRMALLRNAGPAAVSFHDFVLGTTARDILERHGFAVPGGS